MHDATLCHHEKYDGSGYPYKLSGDDIPYVARLLIFCDMYEALRSKRAYKEAYSYEKSMDIIKSTPEWFDPEIHEAFTSMSEEDLLI